MMTAHSELSYVATQNKLSSDMTQKLQDLFSICEIQACPENSDYVLSEQC